MITKEEVLDLVRTPHVLYPFGKMSDGTLHCLSVVKWAYSKLDIKLSDDYMEMLREFRRTKEPKFMDAVAISVHFPFVDHIGLYVGDGVFVHALKGHQVMVSKITDEMWKDRIRGFMRHRDPQIRNLNDNVDEIGIGSGDL